MTSTTTMNCHHSCRSSATPPWLHATLADIEQRVKALSLSHPDEEETESDSFADRAENYYQKRPQLLALLKDLYNRFLYLADRYSQSLKPRSISTVHSEIYGDLPTDPDPPDCSSDAESSISFQTPPPLNPENGGGDWDLMVAELVTRTVENELLQHELGEMDRNRSESTRKIELQRSLLEVLDSERMVLLGENARLGFRTAAAEEDGRGLAAEAEFMRRKAVELARCVVQMREDHRMCFLGRKMEDLQAQIYGLERRNRECYEAMTQREEEKGEASRELDRLRAENRRFREEEAAAKGRRRRQGVLRWWGRARKIEWTMCGSHLEGGGKGCCYW